MSHASFVTTIRYIHAGDQGKRGAITVLSEYRRKRRHKFVTNEKSGVQVLVFKQKGDLEWSPFTMKNGEPWRARTSDPPLKKCVHRHSSNVWLLRSANKCYGLQAQRVDPFLSVPAYLQLFLSQVCRTYAIRLSTR
jgi:hypothetical protein